MEEKAIEEKEAAIESTEECKEISPEEEKKDEALDAKKEKRKKRRKERQGIINEFKTFIKKGNVVDLAVGVIIGSAFSSIVTALSNIFLAICTWGIPGGLDALVTCLPAATEAQAGLDGIGQYFSSADLEAMTIIYAQTSGATDVISANSSGFLDYQESLLESYTLYGDIYYYNGANLINWGAFLEAVLTFIIVAVVLFLVVKTFNRYKKKAEEVKKASLEAYYLKHPDERPEKKEEEKPAQTEVEILAEIRDELRKARADREKAAAEAAAEKK